MAEYGHGQDAQMILPVMIGTAGHVDHGKTSLVRLLTGCETDKLKEERERGLTIDLGFAPCRFLGGEIAGIVDVPGHEDFIRNMVAGAASIDVLLLVVAADDGIMPQTIEHLKIVSLLRRCQVMAIITKTDLEEQDRVDEVASDIRQLLIGLGFNSPKILPCSNKNLQGLSEVRTCLRDLVARVERVDDYRTFRMYIERRFSVKGYGAVVTGVPVSGSAVPADQLVLGREKCIVRAVQSYTVEVKDAVAGACAAVNFRDLDLKNIKRGMCLHYPGHYRPGSGAIISLKNISERAIKRISKIRFHSGTFAVNASVKLIDREMALPSDEVFANVRFEKPVVLAAGDRFILRSLSPADTIAGGVVISSFESPLRKDNTYIAKRLQTALEYVNNSDYLATQLIAGIRPIYSEHELELIAHTYKETALSEMARLVNDGVLAPLGRKSWLVKTATSHMINDLCKIVAGFHASHPHYWGLDDKSICSLLNLDLDAFLDLRKVLLDSGKFKINNNRLALVDFSPNLSKQQMLMLEQLGDIVSSSGIQPYARGDVKKQLGACESDMKLLSRLLVEEGKMVYIDNYLVAAGEIDECRVALVDYLRHNGEINIAKWREISGASRNFAVALLEYFDSKGVTRRLDNLRVLGNGVNK